MNISSVLELLHLRWSPRTERAVERIDRAVGAVDDSSAKIRKAALDHAESNDYVQATVDALMEKVTRRDIGNAHPTPESGSPAVPSGDSPLLATRRGANP